VHFDKTLGVLCRLEPSHSPLPLTRGLMRVLRAIIEVPVLSMSDVWQDDALRGPIAAQLVRHNDAWPAPTGAQKLAKESHGRKPITLGLDENIDYNAVLIDCSPEVMRDAVDLEKYFVQVPSVSDARTPSSQTSGELPAELVAPAPDRFVAELYSA
jgi:hypothetical protein